MDVNSLSRITQAMPAVATAIPQDKASENRQVVQAVKALNKTEMFGQDNDMVFQKDPQSQRMIIKIVNRKTQDVVSEIPAEYLLRLAADLKPRTGE